VPDTPSGGSKNSFGFLGRKLGPAPVWLWGLLVVGAYYLYTRYKSGSSSSAATDPAQVTDPATGVTYAQELSDAEDQITQLQAQLNAQQQGQVAPATIDVTQTQTQTQGPGTTPKSPAPKPKPGAEKKIPVVTGNEASRAISTIEAAGFETHTSPARDPAKTYTATGTTPSGEAPEGSVVVINVRESGKGTTKAKRTAKPKRTAPAEIPGGPVVLVKPKPVKHPAIRGKAA
jgi:hypothetical protein